MLGLERIIDKLFELWDDFWPIVIIEHYNRGVRTRWGVKQEILNPGRHYKVPFIDTIHTAMVKTTTLSPAEQSLTTKDDKSVVIRITIKYEVVDVATLLLECNGAQEAISDIAQGIVQQSISTRSWDECKNGEFLSEISRRIKLEAKKWGLEVTLVTVSDLQQMRSIRILNNHLL
jgi:regulator of protease activity HflC (stomatin/prohibitin superfamily)